MKKNKNKKEEGFHSFWLGVAFIAAGLTGGVTVPILGWFGGGSAVVVGIMIIIEYFYEKRGNRDE